MIFALLGLAWAGGLTHRSSREPIPARWVERPVVLPAGWKQVEALAHGTGSLGLRGRMSLGPAVELRAQGATHHEHPLRSQVGAALALGRREAPARSAALTLAWEVPRLAAVAPVHRVELGVPVRRQWGGSRWTLSPVADVASAGEGARIGARGEVGVQAGPLGARARAAVWHPAGGARDQPLWTTELGGFVQVNRAILLHGAGRQGSVAGLVLGVELSL